MPWTGSSGLPLSRCWPRWMDVLEIVKSKAVVGWHRAGFRLYWRWHSRGRGGRPKITAEMPKLIHIGQEEASEFVFGDAPAPLFRLHHFVSGAKPFVC